MKIFKTGIFKEGGKNPYIDWVMILTVSALVLLVLIYHGFVVYQKVQSVNLDSNTINTNNKTFNKNNFDLVARDFQEKELRLTKNKSGYKTYTDPSK